MLLCSETTSLMSGQGTAGSLFLKSKKWWWCLVGGLKKKVHTSAGGLFISRKLCWNLHFSKRNSPDCLQMNIAVILTAFIQTTSWIFTKGEQWALAGLLKPYIRIKETLFVLGKKKSNGLKEWGQLALLSFLCTLTSGMFYGFSVLRINVLQEKMPSQY